jgi:malonate transporter
LTNGLEGATFPLSYQELGGRNNNQRCGVLVAATIIGALLPIVITLLLGFIAGWHQDFNANQATILNRMVMLYALPLALFSGMVGVPREQVLSQAPLVLGILAGMAGGYAVVFLVSRYFFRRDLAAATLQALAISGPSVPVVGVAVLGRLFGATGVVPTSAGSLVMNLILIPASLLLLSVGAAQKETALIAARRPLTEPVADAVREPVVWAPLLALAMVLFNVHFPKIVESSFLLLGHSTGGVALFASGIVLYSRRVALDLKVSISVLARNIVIPGVMWGLMVLVGMNGQAMREVVLTLAIPTASIIVIFAVQYHAAEQEMASTLFFSTIFSVATMGGFIWLTA